MSRQQLKKRALDIVAGRNAATVGHDKSGPSGMTLVGIGLWSVVLVAGVALGAYVFLYPTG
jgi:hypothetical protein